MIKYALFLFLLNANGEQALIIEFEIFDTMKRCETVLEHVVNSQPHRLEGLCVEKEIDHESIY